MSTPEPTSVGSPLTPQAPRLGAFYDNYQPYGPRKSARVAERALRVEETPPPRGKNIAKTNSLISPPATVKTHSRKKDVGAFDIGFRDEKDPFSAINGMLATPAKTPTSKRNVVEGGVVGSVARNIFSSRSTTFDEVMPSPKKKKKLGYEITGHVEEEDAPIKIYTDTKERIPEVDNSNANPFYGTGKNTASKASPAKRRKLTASKSGEVGDNDHVFGLEGSSGDGGIFNFRGKKIWRSYDDHEDIVEPPANGPVLEAGDDDLPARLTVPLDGTGKGKWLFGKYPGIESQEEEKTDVEEGSGRTTNGLKHKAAGAGPKTPTIPTIVEPARLPTSPRVTRAGRGAPRGQVSDEDLLRGSNGTFSEWRRTRSPVGRGSPLHHRGSMKPGVGMSTRSSRRG